MTISPDLREELRLAARRQIAEGSAPSTTAGRQRRRLLSRRRGLVVSAAALVAATGGAAAAVGGVLPTPNLGILTGDAGPKLNAAQARLVDSQTLRQMGFDVQRAHTVRAPEAAGTSTWLLGRSADGVCVVTLSATTTCVPTATFNREGVFFLAHDDRPAAEPIPTGAELESAKKAGGFASQDVGSSSIATVYGAVPDGVAAVALLDAKGKPGVQVPTPDNVYQLDDVDLSSVSGLQLIRKGGESTVAPLGFAK